MWIYLPEHPEMFGAPDHDNPNNISLNILLSNFTSSKWDDIYSRKNIPDSIP